MDLVKCPNCGREVAVIYNVSQYECPHCGQRWGIRKFYQVFFAWKLSELEDN